MSATPIFSKIAEIAKSSFFWIFLILLWVVGYEYGLLNSSFFSSPQAIAQVFTLSDFWKVFFLDGVSTLSRLMFGLVLAYLTSFGVMYLSYVNPFPLLDQFFRQVVAAAKFIPAPVIIPLAILFLGINDAARIGVIWFTASVLLLQYLLGITDKEEKNYQMLQQSWNLNRHTRFSKFFFPIANFLSYRVWPGVIIWSLGIGLITEIILGSQFGLGSRILQFQQLYKVDFLYGYLILILLIAAIMEKTVVQFFSRFIWDKVKIAAGLILLLLMILSMGFFANNYRLAHGKTSGQQIVTYKAVANLPIFVMLEKYNSLNLSFQTAASGLQVLDSVQAGKTAVGGYADMPNVIQASGKNSQLRILSQVVETPASPTFFFLTSPEVSTDFSLLKNAKIGYYPNNPVVQQGLELFLFGKGVPVPSLQFIGSNDPVNLPQSLSAGKIQALVTVEPYATLAEKNLSVKRINSNESLIRGITFERLPLAALVFDAQKFGSGSEQLSKDLEQSLQFISQHTNRATGKADSELAQIMQKYELDPESQLPRWESKSDIDVKNTLLVAKLMKTLAIPGFDEIKDETIKKLY